jgi:thymidylate synthase (FAD)
VTHELVRHRIGFSYTQESTRYCNYGKGKFGNQITVIHPPIQEGTKAFELWWEAMRTCEEKYLALLEAGVSPQIARGVLPNDLKTDIVVTANLQAWRYLFWMRTHPAAHPQMVELMTPIYRKLRELYPPVFDTLPFIGSRKPSWIDD